MVMSTMAIGSRIEPMGKEFTSMRMARATSVSSWRIARKAKVSRHGQMASSTKANILEDVSMAMANLHMQTALIMMEVSRRITSMAKVDMYGVAAENTRDSGKITKPMAEDFFDGPTVAAMMASTGMTARRVTVSSDGRMAACTR